MARLAVIITLLLTWAFPAEAQLATNLTSCWTFESDGTDATGANGLTPNNTPTFAAAKVGNGLSLVGTSIQSEHHADNASLSTGDIDFTIGGWVNLASGGALRVIAGKHDGSTAAGSEYLLYYDNASNHFQFVVYSGSSSQTVDAATFGNVSTSTWYFVVAWHDAAANQIGISINGVVDTASWSSGVNDSAAEFAIGALYVSSSAGWDGIIDEEFYYKNRVLTSADITSAYNSGSGKSCATMLADTGISFDTATNSGYQTAQSTYSWSHTTSGSDRYLRVGVSMLSVGGSSVTGITYNSVALSLIGSKASVSGAVRCEEWGLIAPATGSHTIAVTLTTMLDSAAGAASYTGVQQTSPTEGFNSASATNVGAADATVAVTTVADNDLVVDVVASDDTAITVGAGQTSRWNVTGALGSGAGSEEGPKTPAGSVTMSWTNVAALATWSTCAVALRPVAAGALSSGTNSFMGLMRVGR